MKQRVIEIIEKKKLTSSKFADTIGVPRSTISHILSGRNKPSLELITKIADNFPEISLEWLLKGKGSMHRDQMSLFESEAVERDNLPEKTDAMPDDKKEKKTMESSDVDDVPYGTGKRNTGDKPDSMDKKTQLGIDKGNISKIIMVFGDNTFEVLSRRR